MSKSAMPPESGIHIDNALSLSLHRRSKPRQRWLLILLTFVGAIGSIYTFLSMFAPEVHSPLLIAWCLVLVIFFGWHAEHPSGAHWTILVFFGIYLTFLWFNREQFASGVLYLMNVMYKTIYMTEWDYFVLPQGFNPARDMDLFVTFFTVPVAWLLSNAVMRYHSLILSFLVTFPFVEIGFFFGVTPSHIPASLLVSFWVAMIAVRNAGGGSLHTRGKSGFVRKPGRFEPVPSMRLLLTEHAGIWALLLSLALFWDCEYALQKAEYMRPEKVKELRTDFQYYCESIDWSDLSTIFPFLYDDKPQEERVTLGKNDKREFDEVAVTRISFDAMPEDAVYLRFSGYATYDRNRWDRLNDTAYQNEAIFDTCMQCSWYPAEFLAGALYPLYPNSMNMTLSNPNEMLSRCVPYSLISATGSIYRYDTISADQVRMLSSQQNEIHYEICNPPTIEYLLQDSYYLQMPLGILQEDCTPSYQTMLRGLTEGMQDQDVIVPNAYSRYFADSVMIGRGGYTEFARAHYLQIPELQSMDFIRKQYQDLWEGYDPQHATPAETMQVLEAIRSRICDSVRYTLAPGKTPPKRDFVAYFLLENHKGYCQHYATAGTILARMAGIPARYCEGYFVSPEDLKEKDGVYSADVLDSSAHAWSEVYIEGFGWIPFEFTYSYFDQPEPIEEPTTEPPAPETTSPAATTTTAATSSAPSETTTTTTAVTPDEEPHVSVHLGVLFAVLVVLLVILAVIGLFVLLRRTALANRNRLFTQKNTDAAAHAVWRYLIELVRRSGANVQAATEGSLTAEMLRTCTAHLDEETIRSVLQIGAKLRYSPHGITREELGLLKSASGKLAVSLYENANPFRKFYYKWICHYV